MIFVETRQHIRIYYVALVLVISFSQWLRKKNFENSSLISGLQDFIHCQRISLYKENKWKSQKKHLIKFIIIQIFLNLTLISWLKYIFSSTITSNNILI